MTVASPAASVKEREDPRPPLVDTHAHLDEPAFDADRGEVIAAAMATGVRRIVNIGYRPRQWATTVALSAAHEGLVHTLGLHPQHADELTDRLIDDLADELRRSSAVAVGEIGFDLYRDGPDIALQERAFVAQIELAQGLGLPIVIHQRAAEEPLMAVLTRYPDLRRVVLHSFDGTNRLADFGRERGYYFGVGGLMTRSGNEPLRAVVATLPLHRLLLETDAPYLAPSGVKNRRNEPANIPAIAVALAELLGVPTDEIARQTTENAAAALGVAVEARA